MPESVGDTRPQGSLKLGALPHAVWRTGAYFTPPYIWRRRRSYRDAGLPSPARSVTAIASVLTDEVVLAGFRITRDPPTAEAWQRIEREVEEALDLYERNGWLDDPARYHLDPSVPPDMSTQGVHHWERLGLPWEALRWRSDWAPHDDEPGRQRWIGYDRNHRASAWMLRHRDASPRRWAVMLHGTDQGRLLVDQQIFRARWLHHKLGCNVVMPLLPLHASRRPRPPAGTGFPTLDVMDNIHGLAQAAYDVRSLLAWIGTQNPLNVSITGLSLGGSVAALVAGLEPPLGAVVGLVPAVDFPEVFRRQTPRHMSNGAAYIRLHDGSRRLHEVVSPLSFQPVTQAERLHILAGLNDRLLDPLSQGARLAEHWGTSEVRWLDRGHVTHMASAQLKDLLEAAITSSPDPDQQPSH